MDRDHTRAWMVFEDLLASDAWPISPRSRWQTVFGEDLSFLQYFHLRTVIASAKQVSNLLIRSEWNSLFNGKHVKRVVLQSHYAKPSKDFADFLTRTSRSEVDSLRTAKGSELGFSFMADARALADYLSSRRCLLVVMLQVDRFSERPLDELCLEDRCNELRGDRCVYTVATRPNLGETDAARRALSSVSQLMGKWILAPEILSRSPVHPGEH